MNPHGRAARGVRAPAALALALALTLALASAPPAAAIVEGSPISIEQAPWQVYVTTVLSETEELVCGGTIIGEYEVLTAAHCLFDPKTKEPVQAQQIHVLAGTSDFREAAAEQQESLVAQARIDPYYKYSSNPEEVVQDDVAVLILEKKLVLDGSAQAIALGPSSASVVQEGSAVDLTGFGLQRETPPEANGDLYSTGMTVGFSRSCGGEDNAVFVCASSPTGSACHGDSGGGLTATGSPPTLVGVLDGGEASSNGSCDPGTIDAFANVLAPEIRYFIEGYAEPPLAPRGGGARIYGVITAGHTLSCEPGTWSGSPVFTYSFIDSANGQVLQTGTSSNYPLTAADVGRTILCRVQATNAGGTGVGRTLALEAIQAAPAAETPAAPTTSTPAVTSTVTATEAATAALIATDVSVQSNGTALVKLTCQGNATCRGKLTLTVKRTIMVKGRKTVRTVASPSVSFSVPRAGRVTVKLALGAPIRRLLATAHGRLGARLAILELQPAPSRTQVKSVELRQQKAPKR